MKPSFSIRNSMLNMTVEISKAIGNLEFQVERNLRLRKDNRIKSIHSSLAIENNSLSLEQITDIIDGKRVLGNPREIKEVKNAYDAYEEIMRLRPYEEQDFLYAHSLLMKDMVRTAGQYRSKDVGIFDDQGKVVHMGARPQFLPELMSALFSWGAQDDTPEIIKSCVFHYEIETIHPFEDGNGRMGRLWQTVILRNWNPLFAWIPVETIIQENQATYYLELAKADHANDSSDFIEFMLDIILQTLVAYKTRDKQNDSLSDRENQVFVKLSNYLIQQEYVSTAEASKLLGKSVSTVRSYLAGFVELGLLESHGNNKNRKYSLKA